MRVKKSFQKLWWFLFWKERNFYIELKFNCINEAKNEVSRKYISQKGVLIEREHYYAILTEAGVLIEGTGGRSSRGIGVRHCIIFLSFSCIIKIGPVKYKLKCCKYWKTKCGNIFWKGKKEKLLTNLFRMSYSHFQCPCTPENRTHQCWLFPISCK